MLFTMPMNIIQGGHTAETQCAESCNAFPSATFLCRAHSELHDAGMPVRMQAVVVAMQHDICIAAFQSDPYNLLRPGSGEE
jgi:hypothetical protein